MLQLVKSSQQLNAIYASNDWTAVLKVKHVKTDSTFPLLHFESSPHSLVFV